MNIRLRKTLSLLLCVVLLTSTLYGAMAVSVVTAEPSATAEAIATSVPPSADELDAVGAVEATDTPKPSTTADPDASAAQDPAITAAPDGTVSPTPVTTASPEPTATPVAAALPPCPVEPSLALGYYYIVANEEATVVGFTDPEATELILPRILGGVKVTAIGDRAFATLEKLARIALHENVKTIASDAFPPSLRVITGPAASFAQAWALEHGIAFEADATGVAASPEPIAPEVTASPEPTETEVPILPTESPVAAAEELPSAMQLMDIAEASEGFESEPCVLYATQSGAEISATLSGPEDTEFWEIYSAVGDGEFTLLSTQPQASYRYAGPMIPGQTYHFKARAGKAVALYTEFSEVVSITMRPGTTVLSEPAWADVDVLGLTWSPVSGASGYEVLQLDKDGHLRQVLLTGVTETTATVTNLPAEEIWLAVRAYVLFEGKRVVSDLSNVRTMTIGSNPVPVLKAVASTDRSVSLRWTPLPGAMNYTLRRSPVLFGTSYLVCPTSASGTTWTMPCGGRFYFTLEAQFASGVTTSAAVSVVLPLDAPVFNWTTFPTDQETKRQQIVLSWKPIQNAEGYSYGYYESEDHEYRECGTTAADVCTATIWRDKLPTEKNLHFAVCGIAYDDHGVRMLGKLGTPYEYYGVYRISAVVPQIDVLIQTSWNTVFVKPKNTGGETTFQVYASNGVETSTYANDIISNEGGFVEIHSPYAQKIDFAISAGEHGRLSDFKTLTLSKTYVPAIRAASYDAIGHVYLNWNAVTNATGYVLQYTTEYGTVPFSDLATIPAGTTSYAHATGKLESGTTVSYRIQCQDVPFSDNEPVRHIIIPCRSPEIQGISAGVVQKYKVTVTPVPGADDYDFQLCPAGTTYYNKTFLHQSETLELPASSYKSGVAYEVSARSNRYYPNSDNGVTSSYSAKYPFIDLETPTVSVQVLDGTSLRIGWNAVTGADGYELRYAVNGGEAESASSSENSYMLSGLPSNAVVTASVRAKRTLSGVVFQSTFANDVTVTLAAPPEPPELPTPTAQTSGSWRYITDLATGSVTVLGYTNTSATALVVPETLGGAPVESIGSLAFAALPNLRQITLHGGIRYFPADAFASTKVVIAGYPDSPVQSLCRQYGYRFIILSDAAQLTPNEPTRIGPWLLWVNRTTNTASIYGYDGPDSAELLVPGMLEGITVTSIEPNALTHLSTVQKLYIPACIQQIRRPAFPSKATLYCIKSSAAYRYALATNTAYQLLDRVDNEKLSILSLVQDSYNSVTLQTNTLDFAQGFEVYRAEGTGPSKQLRTVKMSGTLLLRDTNLTAGKTYRYQIRAYSDANYLRKYSERSPEISIEIRVLPPSGFTAVQNAPTAATMSWIAPKGANGYELLALGEDGWKVLATAAGKTALTLSNLDLPAYTFAVRAYKTVGKSRFLSELSEPVHLTMVSEVIPRILSATPCKDAKSVKIQWSKVTAAKGYRVYTADAPEGPFSLAGTLRGATSTALTHRFATACYSRVIYYQVAAMVGTTDSEPSPVVRVAIPCKPLPAPVLTFSDFAMLSDTSDAVSYFLCWKPIVGAVEYDVFITRTGQGKTVSYTRTTADAFIDFPLDSGTGILPEYSYSFQVAAVFLCEDCGRVVGAKCAAKALIVADAPAEPRVWQTSATSLSASWPKVTGASGYAVHYRRVGESTWQTVNVSTAAKVSLSRLQTGEEYELQVAALRRLAGKTFEGKSTSSVYLNIRAQYAPQITRCAVSKVYPDYVNASFSWTPVKGAIGYNLYYVDGDIEDEDSNVYYYQVKGTSVTINYTFGRSRCYPILVTAVYADKTESDFSNIEYLLTQPLTPSAPTCAATGSGGVKLGLPTANYYVKVWRASSPTGKRELVRTCATGQLEYIDTGLHQGVTYYYWLTTVHVSPDGRTSESSYSPMASFKY